MGVRYDLLLTTGMELAAIARASASERASLRRLSHGSHGGEVDALQAALGLAVDGDFGPETKMRLTEVEAEANEGSATGIYTMFSQGALGFSVL
jgi:hypothetical protein